MRRRKLLASSTALISSTLAGCVHPPVVLDMNAATADDIASEVSITANPGSEEYHLIRSARENGSATRHGRHALFDSTNIVRMNGTVYKMSETEIGRSEATAYDVILDLDPKDQTPHLGEIDYQELPAADRQRLAPLITGDVSGKDTQSDLGVAYGTAEDIEAESVFVPDQQYDILVHNSQRYRVTVDAQTTFDMVYRYKVAETVAPTVEAFADQVRKQYQFSFTGLSKAERAVVEKAITDGYYENSDAFQSVLERIRAHKGITVDDFYGTWLIDYEGTDYLAYAEW